MFLVVVAICLFAGTWLDLGTVYDMDTENKYLVNFEH